jgi:hypothetical protein
MGFRTGPKQCRSAVRLTPHEPGLGNVLQARLSVEPFGRASDTTLCDQMVLTHGTVRARSAYVTDRNAAIRVGCVVLVELRGNVQTLG